MSFLKSEMIFLRQCTYFISLQCNVKPMVKTGCECHLASCQSRMLKIADSLACSLCWHALEIHIVFEWNERGFKLCLTALPWMTGYAETATTYLLNIFLFNHEVILDFLKLFWKNTGKRGGCIFSGVRAPGHNYLDIPEYYFLSYTFFLRKGKVWTEVKKKKSSIVFPKDSRKQFCCFPKTAEKIQIYFLHFFFQKQQKLFFLLFSKNRGKN